MPALALEVNDAGLLALRAGAPRPEPESPGLALFEDGGVFLGAPAAARAYLNPRFVQDRFWDALDREPLRRPFPKRLTAADLAHAHLLALAHALEEAPDMVLLVVPGFWKRDALGLLLSIARTAALPVQGLVDAAVASAVLCARGERLLHLELTRHRAVFTVLTRTHEVVRTRVVDVEGPGVAAFEKRFAEAVARRFVAETRFDPLHSGVAEQALYDALPGWLAELRRTETCPAAFRAGGREHKIELTRSLFEEGAADLYQSVLDQARALLPPEGGQLLVASRASRLPGLAERLRSLQGHDLLELPKDAALVGALKNRGHIVHGGLALPFVTRLPAFATASSLPKREGQRPTHLLNGDTAHLIAPEGLAIGTAPPPGGRGLGLRQEGVAPHHCSLRISDGEVLLEDHSGGATLLNGAPVGAQAVLRAGDRLRLGPSALLVLIAAEEDA